jgi:hypothetical protein
MRTKEALHSRLACTPARDALRTRAEICRRGGLHQGRRVPSDVDNAVILRLHSRGFRHEHDRAQWDRVGRPWICPARSLPHSLELISAQRDPVTAADPQAPRRNGGRSHCQRHARG